MATPVDGPPPDTAVSPAPEAPGPGARPGSTNGLAVASLVLGILWLAWLGSILALIFGYIAKSQIDRAGGRDPGRGLAIAGIVLGWVGIGALVLTIGLVVIGASSNGGSDQPAPGDGSERHDPATVDKALARQALDNYAQATRDKDYERICNDLYSSDLVERVRAAGLPCEVALRTGLEDRQNQRLQVLGIEVNGSQAVARVRTSATGEAASTDLLRLVKQRGDWRVASLSPGTSRNP